MAKQMVTLYVVKHASGYEAGKIEISNYDLSSMDHLDCILLDTTEVEVHYADVDTRLMEIEKLEAKLQLERAESQGRVNLLLDRISKLRCITHEVEA